MRLAILMTNTDDSDFSQSHPLDGEKWCRAIHAVRPDWKLDVFAVKDGIFPESFDIFDGAIITGSPASVHDQTPWMVRLSDVIRRSHADRFPLFGACFGHQAIALALGGEVTKNPQGWAFGTVEVETLSPPDWMGPGSLTQYAAHIEQVSKLPENARPVLRAAGCETGGYTMGHHIFCSQYHPEMSHEFITALVEELAESKPADVIERARDSLKTHAQNVLFMGWVARFFEQAKPSTQSGQ
ncbi:MAG: type 1 glutamine amidotransferase [Pelagimonas sp.]|uniref:type 1 glutamine amidotransferase n=1 Tax=Pelagimonas sp. TaxID=2073170 RepID=UPI003D6B3C5F